MSLPATLTFTLNDEATPDTVVVSKANQDNFGATYRGKTTLADSSANVVATVKVRNRDEGSTGSPKERHIIDANVEFIPLDGSPSYSVQTYIHVIHPKGMATVGALSAVSGISNFADDSHATAASWVNWELPA
jgi:hypothetical protein